MTQLNAKVLFVQIALLTLILISLWQGFRFIKLLSAQPQIETQYYQLGNKKEAIIKDHSNIKQLFHSEQKIYVAPIKEQAVSLAPVTFPVIKLHGIIENSNPNKSLAIISLKEKQQVLGVGEKIKKTEILITYIDDNEITLDLNGNQKKIKLAPKFTTGIEKKTEKIRPIRPNKVSDLQRLKKEILANPAAIMTYIRFNPVFGNGTITAYRISPGKNAKLFSDIGLKEGDEVHTVSGANFNASLSDSNALLSLWPKMKDIDSFTLHLKRNEQQHEVVISLR